MTMARLNQLLKTALLLLLTATVCAAADEFAPIFPTAPVPSSTSASTESAADPAVRSTASSTEAAATDAANSAQPATAATAASAATSAATFTATSAASFTATSTVRSGAAIVIDKDADRLTVPGRFTGAGGMIDRGACGVGGRAALAVVALDVKPSQIAAAMTALGVQPGQVPIVKGQESVGLSGTSAATSADPGAAGRADGESSPAVASAPTGRQVNLFVTWLGGAKDRPVARRARLEDFFLGSNKDRLLPAGPWVYAGSKLLRDPDSRFEVFVADLSGSVAAISRHDTSALFYFATEAPQGLVPWINAALAAPRDTPCQLVIELLPEEQPRPEEKSPPPSAPAKSAEPAPAPPPPAAESASQPAAPPAVSAPAPPTAASAVDPITESAWPPPAETAALPVTPEATPPAP